MPPIRRDMVTADNARRAWAKVTSAWHDGGATEVVRRASDLVERYRRGGQFGQVVGQWPGALVMLADADPPQCWHYRVEQKREAAAVLDVPFRVIRPTSSAEVLSAVQLASVLIIYRQPDSSFLEQVIAEARRLGVLVVYEADDAVYRQDLVAANPNMATLPAKLRKEVVAGADRYLTALRRCDAVLASTEPLAVDMAAHLAAGDRTGTVAARPAVMPNGIDEGMRAIVRGVQADRDASRIRSNGDDGRVVIGYGSGSRAHDADLAVAADALRRLLVEFDHVECRFFGPLALPEQLSDLADRVRRVELLPDGQFLWELAQCDIAIAPLRDVEFNRFKSQVKYLEAAMLGLPFVASPTVYGDYVEHGRTGFIAADSNEWYEYLRALVIDAGQRQTMGEAARTHVQTWRVAAEPARQLAAALQQWGMGARVGAEPRAVSNSGGAVG